MTPMMRILGTLFYKFFGAGLSFLIAILTANYLGPTGRGYLTATITNFSYYSPIVGSFSEYIPYGINKQKHDPRLVFSTALWFATILVSFLLAVALLGTPWLWNGFGPFEAMKTRTIWFALLVAPFSVFHVYVTRLIWGLDQHEWLNRLNTVQSLLFIPLLTGAVLFAPTDEQTLYAMGAWFLSFAVTATVSAYVAIRHGGVTLIPRPDLKIRREMFRYGTQLMGARLLTITNMRIDFYIVFFLIGVQESGVYSIAVTIAEMLMLVSGSILQVVMPRVSSLAEKDSSLLTARTFRHTAIILLVAMLGFYIVMPWLIPRVFGEAFAPAVQNLMILLPGAALLGLATILTTFFTNQLGRPKLLMALEAISIVVNLSIALLLIPHLGAHGAAFAKVSANAAIFLFSIGYFAYVTRYPAWKLFVLQPDEIDQYKRLLRKITDKITKKKTNS
ncbi:oligosaccharide flippase family protein [Tumebacillus sp. DT12]|uniref:Oligosaccharide flippase family protein n=1 Tax=Tumebacillus lacus TaxID=2995335 RepID=A0ABT3X318_9BACL|nr:oligosaccharide flippase family protein [Tumebacillus lacus]MCX7569991.1 oligosaccharide flippase family protein [Tumebacillus lacus]